MLDSSVLKTSREVHSCFIPKLVLLLLFSQRYVCLGFLLGCFASSSWEFCAKIYLQVLHAGFLEHSNFTGFLFISTQSAAFIWGIVLRKRTEQFLPCLVMLVLVMPILVVHFWQHFVCSYSLYFTMLSRHIVFFSVLSVIPFPVLHLSSPSSELCYVSVRPSPSPPCVLIISTLVQT